MLRMRVPGMGDHAAPERLRRSSCCAAPWTGTSYAYAVPCSLFSCRPVQVRACHARLVPTMPTDTQHNTQLTSFLLFTRYSLCGFWLGSVEQALRTRVARGLSHTRNRSDTAQHWQPEPCAEIGSHQPVCRSFAVLSADIESSCLS